MTVSYVWSENLLKHADKLPSNPGRASRVHSLIDAFGLVDKCSVIKCTPCTGAALCKFHTKVYIDHLLTANDEDGDSESERWSSTPPWEDHTSGGAMDRAYGLEYDCPNFEGLPEYITHIAGATLQASESLLKEESTVAINWTGGRHHAKKAAASGFCYVNDIALAILRLRTKFSTVMYIDFDLHHGDGVEAAFLHSPNVITVSIHRYGKGFFPGTGGTTSAKRHPTAINVPLKRGVDDELLKRICREVVLPAIEKYTPDAFVVNFGSDGLARDEHAEWNLTPASFRFALEMVLDQQKPTLLVGGGGYHSQDTAKCWTYLTATALGVVDTINWESIPEHDYYGEYQGDGFQFMTKPIQRKNDNSDDYVNDVINIIHRTKGLSVS